MAGFIFAIGEEGMEGIKNCAKNGVYSTFVNGASSIKIPFEGTMADYCSMNEGDNVYFFYKRKIYGVGVLKKVGLDCKYNNYLDASKLVSSYIYTPAVKSEMLVGNNMSNHWVCLFVPCPEFFLEGVDTDDLLSYKPQNLKRIRTFWKTSFIKVDDLENDTIKEFIYLKNLDCKNTVEFDDSLHKKIASMVNKNYLINPRDLISGCLDASGTIIKHEMAIEAILVDILNKGLSPAFGKWDFVTHQLCASPFKPIDYMDKIDIFAYKYKVVENSRFITKYLILELKANAANDETVTQVLKYVDFVCKEYAYGDYSLIEAYVLANDISSIDTKKARAIASRIYNVGSHPIISKEWCDLHLVKYEVVSGDLKLTKVDL